MKNLTIIVLSMVAVSIQSHSALAASNSPNNIVTQHLASIVNHVTLCSLAPYTVKEDGVKVMHELQSQCSDVKVISRGVAKFKVEGYVFKASIVESDQSDGGDLDDVTIQEVKSGDHYTIEGVLAFDDVLLGVLHGDLSHVTQKEIASSEVNDFGLLKASF